ncbi:hypothetical protein vseg_003020 [Gypsophila vaccaria]
MDLWVVAAAAGAGYIAKHWQSIFRDSDESLGFKFGRDFADDPESSSLIKRSRDETCSFTTGDVSGVGKLTRDGLIGRESSCSRVFDYEQEVGRDSDGNVASEYVFSPEFRNDGTHERLDLYRGAFELGADMSDIPENGAWGSRGSRINKKSVRSRRLHLEGIKPRTSLDSCVMAQMEREHVELDEYLLTPLPSPCTRSLRPFLVSDGKRLISKVEGEFSNGLYRDVHLKANKDVVGVPRLPQITPGFDSKQKFETKKQMGKPHFGRNLVQSDSRAGLSSGKSLFCLGISIGILSTIIANKVEMEKLKKSLKQSENLVEDLQDELEMKDSLTVKELVNDDDSLDIHGILSANEVSDVFSDQADMNVSIINADEESVCPKNDHSITNIEAELEAELERLELTMKGSTLPGELNQEFDQDMIAELVCGELQAENVRRRSSSDNTLDRGPTPHSAKDGVSPRDLTLRLHEVIQSRLEERVMELEAELSKCRNQIHHLVSEKTSYWREFPNGGSDNNVIEELNKLKRSRDNPSQVLIDPKQDDPLVMNLSGDALDAYNEAFEELNKPKRSKDEPFQTLVNHQRNDTSSSRQSAEDGQTRSSAGSSSWLAGKREEAVPISITGIPSSEDSPNDDFYNSDGEDDMLLIKQIVEKARQGSPAILNAQKAMVSLSRYH